MECISIYLSYSKGNMSCILFYDSGYEKCLVFAQWSKDKFALMIREHVTLNCIILKLKEVQTRHVSSVTSLRQQTHNSDHNFHLKLILLC